MSLMPRHRSGSRSSNRTLTADMAFPQVLTFTKMHGAGNDFVVLDLRDGRPAPDPAVVEKLANRHMGVGFDQLLTIEPSSDPAVVASYRIWNADGSLAGQCGNGARCVAAWLARRDALDASTFAISSPAGVHAVRMLDDGQVAVEMGAPRFVPAEVPLAGFPHERDEYILSLHGESIRFGAVSMGNPHAVLEVGSIASAPVDRVGQLLQHHPSFPDSVNVGFVQVIDRDTAQLRVFERGSGETLACGSGACAAAVVLMRRGRLASTARVALPGGILTIAWAGGDSPVWMTGPATFVFEGEWMG